MPDTKTAEMIVLPAKPLKPIRRVSSKEAAMRMLRDLSAPQNESS